MDFLQFFRADMLLQYLFWLCVCFGLFSLLAQLFPNIKGQSLLRKGVSTDLVYWFLPPLFYASITGWLIVLLSMLFFVDAIHSRQFTMEGLGFAVSMPTLLQFIISLLITSFIEYGTHRIFHGKLLWKTHSIHHAPKELDWLSGVRMHPLNILFHSILAGLVVFVLGFSPIVYVLRLPFDILYAAMVHANLNWTFGPLRYVFASPVFHRFHHTSTQEGGEKNFSPIFSFVDVLFGTFYMPRDVLPQTFGVAEKVPETFVGQMLYPFTTNKVRGNDIMHK